MPENEFEKKVSSELQGLKFKPSETVWMKVEERIREKKRRRVFIILFLFAAITLLGYWQWDNIFSGKKNDVAQNETSTLKNTTTNNDQNKIEENKQDDKTVEKRSDAENNNNDENQKPTIKKISANKINNSVSKNDDLPKALVEKKEKVLVQPDQKKKKLNITKAKPTTDKEREVKLTERDLTDLTVNQTVSTRDTYNIKNIDAHNKKQDTDQKSDKPLDVEVKAGQSKPDSIAKKDEIKKDSIIKKIDTVSKEMAIDSPIVSIPKRPIDKSTKWKFGIEFTPGISSYNEDLFSFNANKSADLNSLPAPGNTFTAGPAKTSSGLGSQLGGFVKKQFTSKSSISIGLRWAYYSDKLHIGARVDRTASASSSFSRALDQFGISSAYRATGNTSSYKEKYHFIELPLNYEVRLNKNSVHPLSLQLGFKIGRLLASNAIVYDTTAGGIYYKSTRYLNKTQFGFTGGLSWKISKREKFQITTGPVLNFNLNSLTDNPFDKKKYLLFTGLKTSVNFNSRK